MAIYHCSVKTGSRGKGQSAISASAYRSGTKIKDYETDTISDYTHKGGVVYSEVSLCKNAPSEYQDREVLWNAVHKIEKASNARLWREIEVALPKELNREQQIETVREYVNGLVNSGMCADWSLHDKDGENPHAHIMLTTRSIKENGEWANKSRRVYELDENGNRILHRIDKNGVKQYKNRKEDYNNWNDRERIEEWRKSWADCCNKRLAVNQQIDHRSYARQGIEQEPTIHEGYVARKMVANGEVSDRIEINKEIKLKNELLSQIAEELNITDKELTDLLAEKGSALNERIRELLNRRNRTVSDDVRGTSDGERNSTSGETADFIRQTRVAMSCARTKITDSTTSRNDREAERERQRAEEMQRIRAAELRKRADEQEQRERMREEAKKRRNRGFER